MTLTDTGPLYAIVDPSQIGNFNRCSSFLPRLSKPLITTWACFTEAMYLTYGAGGLPMQELLWQYVEKGVLRFHDLSDVEIARARSLTNQYADAPMDLADASLVATAETLGLKTIFTLDAHFYVYQRNGSEPFEVLP